MDKLKRLEIYDKAECEWGRQSQMIAAIEELSELSVEIAKMLNKKRQTDTAIIDELADASIMIEQIIHMHALNDDVNKRINYKLERLKNKLISHGGCFK